MIIILYITSHIFHFYPPWYVYIVAAFDGIGSVFNYLPKKGKKGDKGDKGEPANLVKVL